MGHLIRGLDEDDVDLPALGELGALQELGDG